MFDSRYQTVKIDRILYGAGRGGHHGQVTFTPVEVVLASPGKNVNDTQSRLVSFVREGKLKNP